MSSIAYITDSKLLELHRLHNHKTMNFWRLSNKINFTDFYVNDLVFFLSKDKEHMKGKEKGIVGFGRLKNINQSSVKSMWKKYGNLNGYNTLEEFKETIIKNSKDKKLPEKISSFYLENVTFFQPIYLSECGFNISTNVESYIYLKNEEVVIKLLELAKKNKDIWSQLSEEEIDNEELLFSINSIHNKIKDLELPKKANKILKQYKENKHYEFIQNSKNELYSINGNDIKIVFYHDKDVDERLLIGQARLYKHYLSLYYPKEVNTTFYTSDNNEFINYLLNN